jgi:nucleoside-diphosphate-sugar epimerase
MHDRAPPAPLRDDPPARDVRRRTIVVGAGPIGRSLARLLVREGHAVDLVRRSDAGLDLAGVAVHRFDVRDGDRLAELARGARTIVNCASPPYHRWPHEWPALTDALVRAADRSGAALVNLSNLYAYGPSDEPLRPDRPLAPTSPKAEARARSWTTMLDAHRSGRIRAAEVRASDFVGPGTQSHLGDRVVPAILAGRAAQVVGDPDAPHAWCYREDVARTLLAVAHRDDAFGRAWHAPVAATRSTREAVAELAEVAGVAPVPVRAAPRWLLTLLGLVDVDVRELRPVLYQFERPFLVDDAETRERLGVAATPWREVLAATVAAYRDGERAAGPRLSRSDR